MSLIRSTLPVRQIPCAPWAGFLLLCLFPFAAAADTTDRLIVQFRANSAPQALGVVQIEAVLPRLRQQSGRPLKLLRRMDQGATVIGLDAELPLEEAAEVARQLATDPEIEYAEPDRRVYPAYDPVLDPRYGEQWYLYEPTAGIRAPQGWDRTRGSANTVVAILDTGHLPHADLNPARVLPGYDFISDVSKSNDGNGRDADASDPGDAVTAGECGSGRPAVSSSWHGLRVSGVIAATEGNSLGVVGIDHATRMLPVRVLGKCGGFSSDVIDAMRWAGGLSVSGVPQNPTPAKVINMSFTGDSPCLESEQRAINALNIAGAMVVVAAGNGGGGTTNSGPASCNNVLSVAAIDRAGQLASYSNRGAGISLSAPGGGGADGILNLGNTGTSTPGADTYQTIIGTSITAAQVSAAAALMLAVNPALNAPQIRQVLRDSTRPFPNPSTCNTSICGTGILDLDTALLAALTPPAIAPPSDDGGGGGGGCAVRDARAPVDPLFPLAVLSAWWILLRRRRHKHSGR